MLVGVTNKPLISAALNKASMIAPYRGGAAVSVLVFSELEAAVHPAVSGALLVIDLQLCAAHPELLELLTKWKADVPGRDIIVVDNLVGRGRATGQLFWHLAHLSSGPVISAEEASDPNFWSEVYMRFPFTKMMVKVNLAFDAAVQARGEQLGLLPNLTIIKQQLALSPQMPTVDQMAAELDDTSAEHATKRHNLQTIFRDAGQATPKDFISAFRLLVHNYLRERNAEDRRVWQPSQIATALGCQNSKEMRRGFGRRAGVQYSALARIPFNEVLQLCVNLAVPNHKHRPSYREEIQNRTMMMPWDAGGSGSLSMV